MVPAKDPKDHPILDSLDCNATKTSLTLDPMPFKVGFRAREPQSLERWIRESDERTKGL
ncbi:phenylacetate 2-hydroxylase [Blastomyces silverae]|uniref:Phenylacetate 2-hydroxylase n=1 Tax=Blastomyces silverae TaxID=2060906 RepID=A0A0H1BE18_9EURO|nr:phenylacetate 2-hydroxylase [Blastomyces silverae]